MRSTAATLILAAMSAGQPSANPLQLHELVTLVGARVDMDTLAARVARCGVAFPPTPAIRSHLQQVGLGEADLARLFPTPKTKPRTEVGDCGLGLPLPVGWRLEGERGAWKLVIPDTPPSLRCDVVLRTWTLGASVRDGRDPDRAVLSDLVPAQLRTLLEMGFEASPPAPLAALGVTGVRTELNRDRVGETPSTVDVALFSKKNAILLVRAHLAGPRDDKWLNKTRAAIVEMLIGVAPTAGPTPLGVPGTRILVRTDAGHRIVDRNGRSEPAPHISRERTLFLDPLGVRAPWTVDAQPVKAPTIPDRFNATRTAEAIRDPGSSHLLCAVASDHHPVPGGDGETTSAGRLVYVPEHTGPLRTLLVRTRPGARQPVLSRPRFLPSGHEIVFIDPQRGLCVLPRDGGLPVVLLKERIVAAEPWVLRR